MMLSRREADQVREAERTGSQDRQLTTPVAVSAGLVSLGPRREITPQPIYHVNVKDSEEVIVGSKIMNYKVDNRPSVTSHLWGLEFKSKTKRTSAVRCSYVVIGCVLLLVAILYLVYILTSIPEIPQSRLDIGLNETWYIRREQWGALPYSLMWILPTPVSFVVIGHTTTPYCDTLEYCEAQVRAIQREHLTQQRFSDIGFNYVVGGGGWIFEGRGANVRGTFLTNWNNRIINVGFLGNYQFGGDEPNDAQFDHLEVLLNRLLELGILTTDYKLVGKCQMTGEVSPGGNILQRLPRFEHWVERKEVYCQLR